MKPFRRTNQEVIMKILAIVILAGLAYCIFRFLLEVFKELAEMTAEAWHIGDIESQ